MTFQEAKQYADDMAEVLTILLKESLKQNEENSVFQLNEHFSSRLATYGSTGHEFKFLYKGQYIGANCFLNLDYDDESWCESSSNCSQYFALWQEHRNVFTLYNRGDIGDLIDKKLEFLTCSELNEEYYEQLQFVHPHDIVRDIFIMSFMNLHCSQFAYYDYHDLPSPGELLKIIKDALCDTTK